MGLIRRHKIADANQFAQKGEQTREKTLDLNYWIDRVAVDELCCCFAKARRLPARCQ